MSGAGLGQETGKDAFSISDLGWMTGAWQTAAQTAPGGMQVEEHWTHVAAGTMFGVSRAIAGGRTVYYEYLRIEARPDGIFYVASPKGQATTDFRLTSLAGQTAVFENPKHDFPQKITYRKNPDGAITARVEGDSAGKKKPQEFHYLPMKR
jgi:hypothetical protein